MPQAQKKRADRGKETAPKTCLPGPVNHYPEALLEEPNLLELQRTMANPAMAAPANVLALQRTVGNRAVSQLRSVAGPARAAGAGNVGLGGGREVIQRNNDGLVDQLRQVVPSDRFDELCAGLSEENDLSTNLFQLVRNFSTRQWHYIGGGQPWQPGGDCHSITIEFVRIARVLGARLNPATPGQFQHPGLASAVRMEHNQGVLITGASQGMIGAPGRDGNVTGMPSGTWFFPSGHVVASLAYPHVNLDILFRGLNVQYEVLKDSERKGQTFEMRDGKLHRAGADVDPQQWWYEALEWEGLPPASPAKDKTGGPS